MKRKYEFFPNYVPRSPLPRKVGVVTPQLLFERRPCKHVPNHRLLWSQLDGGLHSLSAFVQFDLDKNLKSYISYTIAKYSNWSSAV